jgi:hypothetical protein
VASAAIFAGLTATVFAADSNSTTLGTSSTSATPSASTGVATTSIDNATAPPFGNLGMLIGEQGFGRGPGCREGREQGFGGFMGGIQVSSAYNQTVTNILENDSDVNNLITQGYTVQSIRPLIQSIISANGTITTQATTALVTMLNGTSGRATVSVDITNAKVTRIVTLTRTVIDKTTG